METSKPTSTVKLAFATDDGEMISDHFGQATSYTIHTVTDGVAHGPESRSKAYHGEQGRPDPTHGSMFAPISDCQVLIAGGMGSPALEAARSAGLEVILAGGTIKAALESYLRGTLQGDPSRVHTHHHR